MFLLIPYLRSVLLSIAVVCGVVLLVAIAALIAWHVARMQRRKLEKQEAVNETIKQHFINK